MLMGLRFPALTIIPTQGLSMIEILTPNSSSVDIGSGLGWGMSMTRVYLVCSVFHKFKPK